LKLNIQNLFFSSIEKLRWIRWPSNRQGSLLSRKTARCDRRACVF